MVLPRFIAKSSGGGKFTENEQMKISSYSPAPSKYNIQDNTKTGIKREICIFFLLCF